MLDSLRARLTLWYVGTFSVVLILFSFGVYYLVSRILYERLDTNLRSTLQIAVSALSAKPATAAHSPSATPLLDDPHDPNQVVALLDADSHVLAKKPSRSTLPVRFPELRAADSARSYALPESKPEADDSCRGVYQRVFNAASGSYYFVVVLTSDESLSDQLDTMQNVLSGAVVLALLLAGSGGWLLARRGLSPLAVLAAATERITASSLSARLPVRNPRDELGRLASQFNDLLSRLDNSFAQQRQFMADASHELRTPLSIMRTAAQVALNKPRRQETEYRDALTMVEQQTARLARIVDNLFDLARADMGQLTLSPIDLYLDELLSEAVHASAVLGDRKGVKVRAEAMPEAPYRGDEALLRQMILNLLDNAVKFTPSGGAVEVRLQQLPAYYQITVTDTGPGIPVEAQPHVFDRFYRADPSRVGAEHARDGAGLGLSIARSITELHRGELILQHSGPDGTAFVVSLLRT